MSRTVTFGEIMVRLAPPGHARFVQAMPGRMTCTFTGAEANVAVALARLGAHARYVTSLPDNPISDACVADLRGHGVDVSAIRMTPDGRLGLFYVERGANQRPSRVIYDRAHSSIACAAADAYDWDALFIDADWFHFTGITPALSENAAACCKAALLKAKELGLTVSCDLNFRTQLWRWRPQSTPRELAGAVMRELLPLVDVLIANEADAGDVLGIHAGASDVDAGNLDLARYPEVAARVCAEFPNIARVAITLRESLSADHNNWGALLYDAETRQAYFAPLDAAGAYRPYAIRNIVDRIGAGDSFGAALIFALQSPDYTDPQRALAFATAASCLKHAIAGDYNLSSRAEIEALMNGAASGRVVR
jgi:2-dehydro-3-deoxygluconokinase